MGLPDFIGSKEAYFKLLKEKDFLFVTKKERQGIANYSILGWLINLLGWDDLEINVRKPIPTRLIFIEIKDKEYKLINIANWTPELDTRIF